MTARRFRNHDPESSAEPVPRTTASPTPHLRHRFDGERTRRRVVVWCVAQALSIVGVVDFDYDHAATGALAVESVALVVIGLWIAGANLLAGPWLNTIRWFGLAAGLGFVLLPVGMLAGGVNHPLTYAGGIGYSIVFPVWAFLMGRHLTRSD